MAAVGAFCAAGPGRELRRWDRGTRSESPDFCRTSGFVRVDRSRARLKGRGGAASPCGFPQSSTEKGLQFAFNFYLLCRIVFPKPERVRKLDPTSHLIEVR